MRLSESARNLANCGLSIAVENLLDSERTTFSRKYVLEINCNLRKSRERREAEEAITWWVDHSPPCPEGPVLGRIPTVQVWTLHLRSKHIPLAGRDFVKCKQQLRPALPLGIYRGALPCTPPSFRLRPEPRFAGLRAKNRWTSRRLPAICR